MMQSITLYGNFKYLIMAHIIYKIQEIIGIWPIPGWVAAGHIILHSFI